jgi:hypothetical protein
MKNLSKYVSLISTSLILSQYSAQAVNITYSEKTKKNSVIFNFKGGTNLPFNLGINAGIDIYPSYSNIVGDLNTTDERWSLLGTGEINLLYNWNLIDAKTFLGDFNPTISPYVGYKHYFSHSGIGGLSFSQIEPTTIFSNAGGINYGLRFTSNLPLGFHVYAEGGATSLLNGTLNQYKPDSNSSISSNGLLLPNASIGATFNIFNLATARAGYNLRYIPDIRNSNVTLNDNSKALLHSFEVGLSFLFFSI